MADQELTLIPVRNFEWTDDLSYMRTLTCKNHPTARYLTKNPFSRGLNLTKWPEDDDTPRTPIGECTCPFGDLVVIVEESQAPEDSK
ncbi:hypothetical protein TR51_25570 [Kitasatospora griseola]|uniref:Uncharacterized protein n=1 Tax=Kitasatospora griseola TaxID=2064 RepID=A0A0D0NTB7_KITGR|nr:hypothetical protein [Kitasatospora griseola]KIQ62411.1 hypothetical protein TR51_25570 [Kitasatospora griseola]